MNRWSIIGCILAGWIGSYSVIVFAAEPLRLVATIPMPSVEGRIDHLAVDVAHQRLFVAALGNNTLEVIDTVAHNIIRNVTGLHEPQGVAILKDRGLVAVASGEDGTCRLFDSKTLSAGKIFDFQSDADNVRYDAAGQALYVGFGDGAIGVVDISAQQRLADASRILPIGTERAAYLCQRPQISSSRCDRPEAVESCRNVGSRPSGSQFSDGTR